MKTIATRANGYRVFVCSREDLFQVKVGNYLLPYPFSSVGKALMAGEKLASKLGTVEEKNQEKFAFCYKQA